MDTTFKNKYLLEKQNNLSITKYQDIKWNLAYVSLSLSQLLIS
jgi:hypothetical protein